MRPRPSFGPQKGAGPAQVALLARRLERVAQLYTDRFGVDVRDIPEQRRRRWLGRWSGRDRGQACTGFDLVADKLSLVERIAAADLVVTGEGYLDEQSFAGKAVGGVARLAAAAGVPVLIVAGDGRSVAEEFPYISLVERFGHERAWSDAAGCLREAVAGWLAGGPVPKRKPVAGRPGSL